MASCRGAIIDRKGDLTAIHCRECGYVHLRPRPTPEQLERMYQDEYYQTHNAGWYEKEQREQWYWREVYRRRMAMAQRLTGIDKPQTYDAGAGFGWFGAALRGHHVVSYEPNHAARAIAQVKAFPTVSTDLLGKMRRPIWHFVHLSLVLEHVLDPLDTLRKVYQDLHPGGVACVVVPNEWNPYQQRLRKWGYSPLHAHHINYFTSGTLRLLAYRAGLHTVAVMGTFPMEWFALHGLNYVKHPKLGKLAHWTRMTIEAIMVTLAPEQWDKLRSRWIVKGLGREVEVWLQKGANRD